MQNRWKKGIETKNVFEMIQNLYKLLLGDFGDFDESTDESITDSKVCIWILFFICTLFLMIVMLNLLIAFVNDSYVK